MEIGKSVRVIVNNSINNSVSTVDHRLVNNSVDSLLSYWIWVTMGCKLYGNIRNRVVI
jgi:hypothetical protein